MIAEWYILFLIVDKRILAGVGIAVIAAVFGGLYFSLQNQKTTSALPTPQAVSPQEATPVPSTTYKDDSGFSFVYPQTITIAKQEIKDSTTYSDLKLSSPGLLQSMGVKVTDTKLTSPDQWISQNKSTLTSPVVKDITFGGIAAKEIRTSDKIIIVAIDQGVLFVLDAPKAQESVYNTIASSFTFAPQASAQTSSPVSSDSQDDSVVEEVVE